MREKRKIEWATQKEWQKRTALNSGSIPCCRREKTRGGEQRSN